MISENPNIEQFNELISEINETKLFSGNTQRFIVNIEKIGRITVERTKSIIKGHTIYNIYEEKRNFPKDSLKSNYRTDYEIYISKDNQIKKIYQKNNPIFLGGFMEFELNREKIEFN